MTFLDYLTSKTLDTKENHGTEVHPAVQRYNETTEFVLFSFYICPSLFTSSNLLSTDTEIF